MKNLLSLILLLTLMPILANAQTEPEAQEHAEAQEEFKTIADPVFLDAIEKGDASRFNSLLESGVDINARTVQGTTPLMLAAFYKRPEFLAALIASGADVSARNRYGNTALINAALSGEAGMIRELLMAGADANARTVKGMTALEVVSEAAYWDEEGRREIIELLKSYGAVE